MDMHIGMRQKGQITLECRDPSLENGVDFWVFSKSGCSSTRGLSCESLASFLVCVVRLVLCRSSAIGLACPVVDCEVQFCSTYSYHV
jgi:hypothetical protein